MRPKKIRGSDRRDRTGDALRGSIEEDKTTKERKR